MHRWVLRLRHLFVVALAFVVVAIPDAVVALIAICWAASLDLSTSDTRARRLAAVFTQMAFCRREAVCEREGSSVPAVDRSVLAVLHALLLLVTIQCFLASCLKPKV